MGLNSKEMDWNNLVPFIRVNRSWEMLTTVNLDDPNFLQPYAECVNVFDFKWEENLIFSDTLEYIGHVKSGHKFQSALTGDYFFMDEENFAALQQLTLFPIVAKEAEFVGNWTFESKFKGTYTIKFLV